MVEILRYINYVKILYNPKGDNFMTKDTYNVIRDLSEQLKVLVNNK